MYDQLEAIDSIFMSLTAKSIRTADGLVEYNQDPKIISGKTFKNMEHFPPSDCPIGVKQTIMTTEVPAPSDPETFYHYSPPITSATRIHLEINLPPDSSCSLHLILRIRHNGLVLGRHSASSACCATPHASWEC